MRWPYLIFVVVNKHKKQKKILQTIVVITLSDRSFFKKWNEAGFLLIKIAYEVLSWVSERLKIYSHEKEIWKIVYSGNNPISSF